VSRTKCWKFFVFKNLGERCEVNRDDCLPDLCRITERVSIKWPITLAFVRLNSWDVIANKNSTLVPVCRVKMAPVASQHDLNPNSIVNVYQVNLKSFKIHFQINLKLKFAFQDSRECTARTTLTNVSPSSVLMANNVSI